MVEGERRDGLQLCGDLVELGYPVLREQELFLDLLRLVDQLVAIVDEQGLLPPRAVYPRERLALLDEPLPLLLGDLHPPRYVDPLLDAARELLRRDVHYAVGVYLEPHDYLRGPPLPRRETL